MRLLLCIAAAALVAGCIVNVGKGDGTPEPTAQCTPPAFSDITVTLTGTHAQSLSGNTAMARAVVGTSAQCIGTTAIAAGGTFQLQNEFTAQYGQGTVSLELVLNSAAELTFGAGDEHYVFTLSDGTYTPNPDSCSPLSTWDLPFDHATAVQGAISWPLGSGC